MKPFDEMARMSPEELDTYLHDEVERVIAAAPPHNVLKLRALQAKLDGLKTKVKDPLVRREMIYNMMLASLGELNNVLNQK